MAKNFQICFPNNVLEIVSFIYYVSHLVRLETGGLSPYFNVSPSIIYNDFFFKKLHFF